MLTLAFESSAKAASAALCEDGRLISEVIQCSGLTHSRTLLPMAEDLLKNAGTGMKEIDCFAVKGPGLGCGEALRRRFDPGGDGLERRCGRRACLCRDGRPAFRGL